MRLLLAVALALILPAAALADTPAPTAPSDHAACFLSRDWQGWSSPPEGGLYLRMRNNDVFRVELSSPRQVNRYGSEFLVNEVHGSSWICSHLDLDLKVSDINGFSRPLIATGLRRMTAEEVAAIPAADAPH